MAKDVAKVKEELKAEIHKLRDEFKTSRESLERDLRIEIRELRTEQRNMTQSLEFSHGVIEELKKSLEAEIAKNANLKSENEAMHMRCNSLEKRTCELEKRITNQEQYSRNHNIEIKGVEKRENERVSDIVSQIGAAIGEPIAFSDIESCHRVSTRNPEKSNIIVQFKSRAKRDVTLKKAKKTRLTNLQIGLNSPNAIFVNEHLCPALKSLLGRAIRRKHEHKWKSVWTFGGRIFARQSDDAAVFQIADEADLDKIH